MTLQTQTLCDRCRTQHAGPGSTCLHCEKLRNVGRSIDRTAALERQWALLSGSEGPQDKLP